MAKRTDEATAEELQTAEGRGRESAHADHRAGAARWPYKDSSLGLSPRHAAVQDAWARAKREALLQLGYLP